MSLDRTLLVLLPLLAATPVLAQTTVTGQPATGGASSATSGGQKAVTRPNTDHAQDGKPASTGAVTGVKLEKAGFHDVKDLKKDADGIWAGSAMMDGKPTTVGLDFKGNVAVR